MVLRAVVHRAAGLCCFILALASWGFSSPAGSAPDGDYHLATIWCGGGEHSAICERPDGPLTAPLVPRSLLRYSGPLGHFCFVGSPGASAGCLLDIDANVAAQLDSAGRFNEALTQSPFSRVMNVFVGRDIESSVLRMRLFNVVLLASSLLLLQALVRESVGALLLTWVAIASPLGLYFVASAHPQSWVFISLPSAMVLLHSGLSFDDRLTSSWNRAGRVGMGIVLIAIAVAVRPTDTVLFAMVATVASSGSRWRRVWVQTPGLAVLVAIVGAMGSYLMIRLRFGGVTELWAHAESTSSFDAIWRGVTFSVPSAVLDVVGGGGALGSSDVPMYAIAPLFGATGAVALLLAAKPRADRWFVSTCGLLAVLPVAWLMRIAPIGIGGRYVWVLAAIALTYYFLECRPGGVVIAEMPRGARRVIVASAGLANAFALHAHIRRYVTGSDVVGWNLNRDAEWWWPFGPAPMTTWLLGSAAFALAAGLVMLPPRRDA